MKTEDFNKQFPSLIAFDREVAPIYSEKDLSRVCTVFQIQKHCLDKKIVREADYIQNEDKSFHIHQRKLKEIIHEVKLDSSNIHEFIKNLEKALGLNEE